MHSIAQDASGMQEEFKGGKAMAKEKYYKRPDGLYEVSRTINGKRVRFRGKTCREVDQKILAYREDRAQGRNFPVVADEWYRLHSEEVGTSACRIYGYAVRRLKLAFPQRIGEITAVELQRYVKQFERQGYAADTVSAEISVIKQIFRYAVTESGDIDASPAVDIRRSKGLPHKKRNALTAEQEAAVEAYRGEHWLFGLMLLYTGMRRGELLALNWQDIDRKTGWIHVNKKISYEHGNNPVLEDHVKNFKPHDAPLFPALAEVLPRDRVGPIFANEDGTYLKQSQLAKLWRQYSAALDLDGITPHCFRHSFATICFEAGIPAQSTAEFMGDTPEVAQKIYTDLRKNKKAEDAAQVAAYLSERRAARG